MTSYHHMSNASHRHRSPDTACVIQLGHPPPRSCSRPHRARSIRAHASANTQSTASAGAHEHTGTQANISAGAHTLIGANCNSHGGSELRDD